jgi:opacity protein-like surface antigen
MTYAIKVGLSVAALAAIFAAPGSAADLGGSMKDGGYRSAPAGEPHYAAPARGPAGNCYFRADAGYSWSKDPSIKFPVGDAVYTDGNFASYTQTGEGVSNTSMGNSWLGEAGFGCGSGSRGIRGEVMFGYRGDRKIQGEPGAYTRTDITTAGPTVIAPIDDPLHTSVKTYTMMFNAYKDLGSFGGVTPYVGAGVGLAYNRLDETYFTGNYNLPNRIHGKDDLAFAWSLMAGVGYQLSDRAVLDLGYRYIDMGKVTSDRIDNTGSVNPRVRIDDLVAHELKIGIRYHFGQGVAEMPAYTPMK